MNGPMDELSASDGLRERKSTCNEEQEEKTAVEDTPQDSIRRKKKTIGKTPGGSGK